MYTFVYVSHPVTSTLLLSAFKALPLLSSAVATQAERKAGFFLHTITGHHLLHSPLGQQQTSVAGGTNASQPFADPKAFELFPALPKPPEL